MADVPRLVPRPFWTRPAFDATKVQISCPGPGRQCAKGLAKINTLFATDRHLHLLQNPLAWPVII